MCNIPRVPSYTKGEGSSSHHKGNHDEKTKAADGRRSQECRDSDYVETVTMYYISLPMEEAHHGHPTGKGVAGFAQRMNDKVAAKLVQIVAEGVTEIKQVRSLSTCTHTLTHKTISQHFLFHAIIPTRSTVCFVTM